MGDPGIYATSNLGLAASLDAVGFKPQSIGTHDRMAKKVDFIFLEEEGLMEAVGNYHANKLEADALTLFESIKRLKSWVYEEQYQRKQKYANKE